MRTYKAIYGISFHPGTYDAEEYFYAPQLIDFQVEEVFDFDSGSYEGDIITLHYEIRTNDEKVFQLSVVGEIMEVWCELRCDAMPYYYETYDGVTVSIYSVDDERIGTIDIDDRSYTSIESVLPSDVQLPTQKKEPLSDSYLEFEASSHFHRLAIKWKNEKYNAGYRGASYSISYTKAIAHTDDLVTIEGKINLYLKGGNPTASFLATVLMDRYSGEVIMTNFNCPI